MKPAMKPVISRHVGESLSIDPNHTVRIMSAGQYSVSVCVDNSVFTTTFPVERGESFTVGAGAECRVMAIVNSIVSLEIDAPEGVNVVRTETAHAAVHGHHFNSQLV